MSVRKRWLAVAAVVAALVVAVSIMVTAEGPPEPDATTAKPVTPAPVPEEPRRAAWTWQLPGAAAQDDTYAGSDDDEEEDRPSIDEVSAAGAGVVVLTDDGLIALDGRTGMERWHYRVPGAAGTDLMTSPRGGWVVLGYDEDDKDDKDDRRHLVALDAMTGRPGLRITLSGERAAWSAADGVLVKDTAAVTSGYDMRTGKRLWSYRMPRGCLRSPQRLADRGTVVRDAMVLGTVCAPAPGKDDVVGTLRVLALDAKTGRQAWSHDETVPKEDSSGLAGAFRDLELESSPDGRFVSIQRWDDTLLDASSGKVLLDPEAMSGGEVEEYGSDWVVVGYYTGEGRKRRYRTVRIDLDDGSRTPANHPLVRPGSFVAAKALAGDRLLGLSEVRPIDDETEDTPRRMLRVAVGEPFPPVEVNLGPSTDEDGDCADLLVAAPGAIVAGCGPATRLIGLA